MTDHVINNDEDSSNEESCNRYNQEEDESGSFLIEDIDEHNEGLIREEMQKRMKVKIDRLDKELEQYQKRLKDTRDKLQKMTEYVFSAQTERQIRDLEILEQKLGGQIREVNIRKEKI